MSKRIIHELDDNALVSLLEGATKDEVLDKASEAAKFIFRFKIRHGTHRVPAQIIYWHYKEWRKKQAQAAPLFFRDFKQYFDQYRTKDGITYLLDPKPFDLSEETWWQIRREHREKKARSKAKKN